MKNMNDYKHLPKEDSGYKKYKDNGYAWQQGVYFDEYNRMSKEVWKNCKRCDIAFTYEKKKSQNKSFAERNFCTKCRSLEKMKDLV